MKTAIAVLDDEIAPSLGTASGFIIPEENRREKILCSRKIFEFLKAHEIDIVICGAIGICTLEMLARQGINVIPGINGRTEDVIELWRKGNLLPGKLFSCADSGRVCGDCKGNF